MTNAAKQSPPKVRLRPLDGIRGLTIILIVLGHAGALIYPRDWIDNVPLLRGFFGGGAVGVFFVVGGYLVTTGLLEDRRRGTSDPIRFYARRLIRIGVQVLPLAIAILVMSRVDPTDPYTERATTLSVLNLVTNTTNLHGATDLLSTRADLGHMWYVAVQQQIYLVLPLLVLLLGGRRLALISLFVELAIAAIAWRFHVLDTAGWIPATISTSTRADAPLAGAVAAVLLYRRQVSAVWATRLLTVSLATLIVLIAFVKELGDPFGYLRWWGVAFVLTATVAVVTSVRAAPGAIATRILSSSPLVWLGRASLAIFVWHLPLFLTIERHTRTWQWEPRAIVSFTCLGLLAWTTHRYLDEPARRWLATHLRPRQVAPEDVVPGDTLSSPSVALGVGR